MIVRIDTTNLTRGREFTLYAKNPTGAEPVIVAVDANTKEVYEVETQHTLAGEFDGYIGIAPAVDGYLFAKIGTQKIAKKIGTPIPSFALCYKPGYTVRYKAYNSDGEEIADGVFTDIGNGFYYTPLPSDTVVVKTLNKNFIINKNLLKMSYEVTMEGGELNSAFDSVEFDNLSLPDIEMQNLELGESVLDSTLPDVTIKEL